MSPNFLLPGTTHEQIAEERIGRLKKLVDRLKAGKEVIAACIAIGVSVMGGTRYLVRQAVRAELAEMRRAADEARTTASAVPKLRDDFESHVRKQAELEATIRASFLMLGGRDSEISNDCKEGFRSIQERIDEYLTRSHR